jgi:hypothetical protein
LGFSELTGERGRNSLTLFKGKHFSKEDSMNGREMWREFGYPVFNKKVLRIDKIKHIFGCLFEETLCYLSDLRMI